MGNPSRSDRTAAATSFYVTGGTLRQDAPSYVERQADRDLYEGLGRGEYCYVLHARQMGKSSLMVHTTARLRREGAAVAAFELTGLGQHLTVEQWYDGLLGRIGRELDLEDELEAYWLEHERLSPLQRWIGALQEVVLPNVGVRSSVLGVRETDSEARTPNTEDRTPSRVVLFLDEIDAVRNLPFSTDEFFAAIRECYNRRSQDPAFERLTFCLLGVATPSDLIQDTRTTPFNIGRRIELTDFTSAEAAPLAAGLLPTSPPAPPLQGEGGLSRAAVPETGEERHAPPSLAGKGAGGLGRAESLLARILYWTGGHPYLTQRLCQAVAAAASVEGKGTSSEENPAARASSLVPRPSRLVDRLCDQLFLSRAAQERDDNLLFVRERLLKSAAGGLPAEEARPGLLDLYSQVRSGKRVLPEDTNQLVSILRLSGVTGIRGGRLRVRNRIYERVFDRAWVTQHMRDAELRRQKAAYRRGLLRATGVSAAVLAVVAALALAAVNEARLAQEGQRRLRRSLYAADMSVAQQAWEGGDLQRVLGLLQAYRPRPGQEELRGWEWRYLWRLYQQGRPRSTLRGHTGAVQCVAFSPDGRILASGSQDGTVKFWDPVRGRQLAAWTARSGSLAGLAFSPDGRLLATEGDAVKLWQVATHRELAVLVDQVHGSPSWRGVAFSLDGKTLASIGKEGGLELWDVAARRRVAALREPRRVSSFAFSPDGKLLARGSLDEIVRLWDLAARRPRGSFHVPWGNLFTMAFSPDSQTLAVGNYDPMVKLCDITSLKQVAALPGHRAAVYGLAFSPDGKILASGSNDNTAKLWSVATHRELATFPGHEAEVISVAFSPDGRTLATGSADQTMKLWDVFPQPEVHTLKGHTDQFWAMSFSSDSKTLVTGSFDRTVRLWDVATGRARSVFRGFSAPVLAAALSPDGRLLATGTGGWAQAAHPETIRLWDVHTRRVVGALRGHTGTVYAMDFSPDGKTLASASNDRTVRLWNLETKQQIHAFQAQTGEGVGGVAFSPGGQTVASGGWEGVQLWDVAARRLRCYLSGQRGVVTLAFSPDGRTVASGSFDKTVRLWDVSARREIARFEAARGVIAGIAFSPDGKTLAIGHQDQTVTLWNLATGREVLLLKDVTGPAFSPDGRILATEGPDHTVRLWRAASLAETDAAAPGLARNKGR